VRAFLVRLPSSVRYWTVVDDGYRVVRVADEYLQHLRLGQDAAESTTKAASSNGICQVSSPRWPGANTPAATVIVLVMVMTAGRMAD
jgi:hypothetical protein